MMFRRLFFWVALVYVGGIVANYSTLIQQIAPNKEPSWVEKVAAGTGAAFWPAEVDWKQFTDWELNLPDVSFDLENIDWLRTLILYGVVCYVLAFPLVRWVARNAVLNRKKGYTSHDPVEVFSVLGVLVAPVSVPCLGIWYLIQKGIEPEAESKKV